MSKTPDTDFSEVARMEKKSQSEGRDEAMTLHIGLSPSDMILDSRLQGSQVKDASVSSTHLCKTTGIVQSSPWSGWYLRNERPWTWSEGPGEPRGPCPGVEML